MNEFGKYVGLDVRKETIAVSTGIFTQLAYFVLLGVGHLNKVGRLTSIFSKWSNGTDLAH